MPLTQLNYESGLNSEFGPDWTGLDWTVDWATYYTLYNNYYYYLTCDQVF